MWGADEAAKVRQVVALLLHFLLCSNPAVVAALK